MECVEKFEKSRISKFFIFEPRKKIIPKKKNKKKISQKSRRNEKKTLFEVF